jgi:hypothetical protein
MYMYNRRTNININLSRQLTKKEKDIILIAGNSTNTKNQEHPNNSMEQLLT